MLVSQAEMADSFKSCLENAAKEFNKLDKNETIRIISHLDADGISACSIILKTLQKQNRNCIVTILNQLNKQNLRELARENNRVYVFTDLGSSQLSIIESCFPEKKVFILDHHKPEEAKKAVHVNPHIFGLSSPDEISGAGVAYLFCKELDPETDLAHLAVIGAIGDVQEEHGFKGLNRQIMEEAVRQGKLQVSNGLRLFGRQTRPLHKLLEYNFDFRIPGVSGSEEGSLRFLKEAGIEMTGKNRWRRLVDLSDEELKRLTASIIIKRAGESKPESIIGPVYTLNEEEDGTILKDAKEFATLLNACGRLGRASLGIGACIGDRALKKKAIKHVRDYRKAIAQAKGWYRENKQLIKKGGNYIIINAEDKVSSTLIGTLASIISKSGDYGNGVYVLALARERYGKTKISLRVAGKPGTELVKIVQEVAKSVGGEAGGHPNAAGALIDSEKEEMFINEAIRIFEQEERG